MQTLIEIPISVLLGAITVLSSVIGTMAAIMWSFMKERLKAQDVLIQSQGETIDRLQTDIERLSGGCGIEHCVWKVRK